jgi:HEPN domain-containing protein
MNTAYKKWLPFIQADLQAAQTLYKSASHKKSPAWHHWALIIWHCHQVVEKSLKMIIIAKDIELLKIHDLIRLVDMADIDDLQAEWNTMLHELNKYYIPPKYPDLPLKKSYPQATQKIAKIFLNFSSKFFIWIKYYLSQEK